MATSSQGVTFAFATPAGQFYAHATSITVEEAQQEIVDMTTLVGSPGFRRVVSTGDVASPPKVDVEWFRDPNFDMVYLPMGQISDILSTGQPGALLISHGAGFSLSHSAVVESASTELAVGGFVRGRARFILQRV